MSIFKLGKKLLSIGIAFSLVLPFGFSCLAATQSLEEGIENGTNGSAAIVISQNFSQQCSSLQEAFAVASQRPTHTVIVLKEDQVLTSPLEVSAEENIELTTIDDQVVTISRDPSFHSEMISCNGILTISGSVVFDGALPNQEEAQGSIISSPDHCNEITLRDHAVLKNNYLSHSAPFPCGGAIMSLSRVTIEGAAQVLNNRATMGGAIYNPFNEGVVLNGGLLQGNIAYESGGAIYTSELQMNGGEINNNTCEDQGGGAFAGIVTITGGTVSNNQSLHGDGGGIYTSVASLENLSLIHNSAASGGGIYVSEDCSAKFVTCTDNFSSDCGGGICASKGTIVIADSTFSNNQAKLGGGVFTIGTIQNTCFFKNIANEGGAVYGAPPLHSTGDNTFRENQALTCGGAVCAWNDFSDHTSEFTGNTAPVDPDVHIYHVF